MIPLNYLMNQTVQLSQASSLFSRYISSKFLNIACIPLEMLASLENLIKLPFQTIFLSIKIPAKILNIIIRSKSLQEFESKLPSPLNVIQTALKIIGYALGTFLTLTFGTIHTENNFKLHCYLGLSVDEIAKKNAWLAEINRQNEIKVHEKIISARLNKIIDTMRKTKLPPPLIETHHVAYTPNPLHQNLAPSL